MFQLTKQERLVVLSLCCVFLVGMVCRYLCKTNPKLLNLVNVMESERVYYKIDINRASADELERIPYIGKMTSRKIIEHRENEGKFTDVEQVRKLKGVRKNNYEKFKNHLKLK